MDAVLGLSMTPTSVGMVLVNGSDADGAPVDDSAFEVRDRSIQSSAQATAAVLRTEAMAATRGFRLHSIGVTWSEDADTEASQLIRSLSESGFDNVVAVRMPEATEAVARGIADVIGYGTTAVCVIEPDVVITLIVHTRDGAVQTALNHGINSDESLISWLSSVFTRADWQPEALVVVGSAGGFDSILPRLESALSVPVFAPEDAQLALARGAALASSQSIDFPLMDLDDPSLDGVRNTGDRRIVARDGRRRLAHAAPLAALVIAAVTFVVSASIAVTLEVSPHRDSGPVEPVSAAVDGPDRPAAARTVPSPAAVPAARSIAPPEIVPPPEEVPPPPPEVVAVDQVAPEVAPPSGDAVPAEAPSPLPPADPAAIPPSPNGYVPPPVGTPVEVKKPPLHSRIMDRLRGIGEPDPGDYTPADPVAPPPP